MMKTAFVTGADRGLGFALCESLLEKNWKVAAGQYMTGWPALERLQSSYPDRLFLVPLDVSSLESVENASLLTGSFTDSIDLIINNAGIQGSPKDRTIKEAQNYDEMLEIYNVNSLGPLRIVEKFLPFLENSHMKRLCFVSSEAGSIQAASRDNWFGYCMSKSALNMAVKNLFNHLRPQYFTFRLYHPGWIQSYMHGGLCEEAHIPAEKAAEMALQYFLNPLEHENVLVLRDFEGKIWPW